jgi:hypothetical protein
MLALFLGRRGGGLRRARIKVFFLLHHFLREIFLSIAMLENDCRARAWWLYLPFPNCGKAIVTPKLTLH